MPHLLIAGSTGHGQERFHQLADESILYKASLRSEDGAVDPKRWS